MNARTTRVHDCVTAMCDNDERTTAQIEYEGFIAGRDGASYDDVPYGHTHADRRFSPWQAGRWKAIGEWCYSHRQYAEWCAGLPDIGIDPKSGPCVLTYVGPA